MCAWVWALRAWAQWWLDGMSQVGESSDVAQVLCRHMMAIVVMLGDHVL
jgi:hypothetical protein